ncbi:MAG: formimidoylglutamase [Gammaproteobacteria bacterium]|nr:formimidoylglutamase [Gammaproteobacteria bacterium]
MLKMTDMQLWQGRIDTEDGAAGKRWHQAIKPLDSKSTPGLAVLGFPSDEGVRRNKGRIGAAKGPQNLRLAMANLPKTFSMSLHDAGDVTVENDDLESAQSTLGARISELMNSRHFPLLLGGGHEIAYGSYQGIARWIHTHHSGSTLGIINFDAHLDLRLPSPQGSSGTPFYQIAKQCGATNQAFNYLCIGAAATANTPALFRRAEELGVHTIADHEITPWRIANVQQQIKTFIEEVDFIYLTIDLDVFPAATMPAVSAPAGRGVSFELFEPLLDTVLTSNKVRLADMAEFNPSFDIDDHGARTAARIAFQISNAVEPLFENI